MLGSIGNWKQRRDNLETMRQVRLALRFFSLEEKRRLLALVQQSIENHTERPRPGQRVPNDDRLPNSLD